MNSSKVLYVSRNQIIGCSDCINSVLSRLWTRGMSDNKWGPGPIPSHVLKLDESQRFLSRVVSHLGYVYS